MVGDYNMVTCPNCGINMQEKDRNCLRCGALNPYNPLNKDLIRNLSQNRINTSFDRAHNIKDSTDAQKGFYIFNFIFLAIISFTCLEIASFSKISGLILFVIASIFFYEFICYQMIQLKAGNPWWVMYFPIVNIYYLLKLAFRKPILQIDRNSLEVINEYPSIKDAAICIGKPGKENNIAHVLHNRKPSAFGYIWRFKYAK